MLLAHFQECSMSSLYFYTMWESKKDASISTLKNRVLLYKNRKCPGWPAAFSAQQICSRFRFSISAVNFYATQHPWREIKLNPAPHFPPIVDTFLQPQLDHKGSCLQAELHWVWFKLVASWKQDQCCCHFGYGTHGRYWKFYRENSIKSPNNPFQKKSLDIIGMGLQSNDIGCICWYIG